MVKLRRLEMTDAIQARIAIARRAAELVDHGGGPVTQAALEQVQAELAAELVEEYDRQLSDRTARLEAVERRPVGVVEVGLYRKRAQA